MTPPAHSRERVLAILQAGGAGSRLDVLTRERAKPALPFGATFRLVDFALSAVAHAAIDDVWVSVQYQAGSLAKYLAGGRPWDLDRTHGGLRLMVPEQGSGSADQDGFARGNADGLYRLRDAICELAPEVVVVMSCDSVMAPDLHALLAAHRERSAECTVLTAEVGPQEARHNIVVEAGPDGRVTSLAAKPDQPACNQVATEVTCYDARVLVTELEQLRREVDVCEDDADTCLGDFGDHLLPRMIDRGRTHAVPLSGYWKDVGRPEAYLQAHRDLLRGRVDVFSESGRPVLSRIEPGPPALIGEDARVQRSMIGPQSVVRGTVRDSVLGPRVVVESGAVVEDCVLLEDVTVRAGARLGSSVIDAGTVIGRGARVGSLHSAGPLGPHAIVLVGRDSVIGAGTSLASGARLEPGTSA
ncbi:glucose-1-phosphate adenylyltransferase family protein [Granulicoccus sp. GXG6511]|uniref:glucose-1-phosphate adenylyltransferase family protein n=1 Tax=Granulicoccus sp. GXG6511 TaxID=3381351 RepID=UPI003D7C65DD